MENGEIIRQFLLSPADRQALKRFYVYSLRLGTSYFHSLRSQGYGLPLDDRVGADPVRDLAIDTLGWLMQGAFNRPFHLILDYFASLGINRFEDADPVELERAYHILLFRHCRQQASRMAAERDPQLGALKRRLREILSNPPFERAGQNGELIFLGSCSANLRATMPEIDDTNLARIVTEAFHDSNNRKEWCQGVFRKLNGMIEFSNRLAYSRIVSAAVRVNVDQVALQAPTLLPAGQPESQLSFSRIHAAVEPVLDKVKQTTVARFVKLGRLEERDGASLIKALRLLLGDFTEHGDTDSIPSYFRETMPSEYHSRYLEDYKYIFETMVKEALVEMRRELR